ncbi:clostripain-related cysteine peptidase [Dysgonomonas sp. GY75]|uniref:clostripain-related cysteine peptidase n=1 Tax=Dysgonomonas sp. GY75 TaxID=2780419 RepID=UPI001F554DDE|nr:clostripain-related cysteine peptidase [Dysgonomonas sp. GY75]
MDTNRKYITMYLLRRITGLLLCAMFLYGCAKDGDDAVATRHVLLVYLAGDNNLSVESYAKLAALGQGWDARPGGKLLVYHDPSDAAPRLLELCRCEKGNPTVREIRRYEEYDSADSGVFASVIDEVRRLYPSPGYGLLVFSHASGWLPGGTLTAPKSGVKSVLSDGNGQMALADFASAIPDGAFDYIVFEACFMAGIEVAFELKDKTGYILASSAEIVSPGFTDVYPQALGLLYEGEAGLRSFAGAAFGYFNGQSGYMRSATLSVIRTPELEALASFIRDNATEGDARDINGIQHFDRYPAYRLFFDFEDYYAGLLADEQQRQDLHGLIGQAVVWKASTPEFMPGFDGFVIGRHSGLTTYIPQEKFPFLNAEYGKLAWSLAIRK